ncbi:MAG: hypothetical protein V2A74_05145, partial [bacterium]
MSKREKIILIVTVVMGVGALLYQFGLSGFTEKIASNSQRMAQAAETHQGYQDQLDKQSSIEEDYRKIEGQFPASDPNRKPD